MSIAHYLAASMGMAHMLVTWWMVISLCSVAPSVVGDATCNIGHHEHRHKLLEFNPARLLSQIDKAVRWKLSLKSYTKPYSDVDVRWKGVNDPTNKDQLALYPCRADPMKKIPANIVNITSVLPSYLSTGEGNFTYPLFNLRDDFCFKLIRGAVASPIIISEAPVLKNRIPNLPSGLHLALGADGRSIVVQWVSGSPKPQTVQWGEEEGHLMNRVLTNKTLTYTSDQMCGYPADSAGYLDPGHLHLAIIPANEMQPGRRYFYRVGSKAHGYSSVKSFLAPIEKGSVPEGGMKFIIFNDVGMIDPVFFVDTCPPWCPAPPGFGPGEPYPHLDDNYAENSTWLSRILPRVEQDAHVALLMGDLAYSQGFVADWDAFAQQFEPAFSMWPMMVAMGNHERDWANTGDAFGGLSHDSGGECGVPTAYRYFTPAAERSNWDPREAYYSFDMGPVHFLVLDSESPTHPESPQGRFVAEDLDSVDCSKTPWVVVGFHRMMYAPLTSDTRELQGDLYVQYRLQTDLEDAFKGKVDVVVSGHSHAYGRTCPVYKQECVEAPNSVHYKPGAPIYILSGNAGAGFTNNFCPGPQVGVSADNPVCNNLSVPSVPHLTQPANLTQPDWVVWGKQFLSGYMRFIATESELKIEAIASHDGSTFDQVTLQIPDAPETVAAPF